MTPHQPDGYSTVSPYLIVEHAAPVIDFLERALDAVEVRRFTTDDGRVAHAEVRIGDSVVMLGEAAPGWPPSSSHVHVYVEDVDTAYARALAAGASSVQEPGQAGDEDRRSGVTDASGTTWWLATRVGPPPG